MSSSDPSSSQGNNSPTLSDETLEEPAHIEQSNTFEPLQTQFEDPIALRKGVRECTKHPLYPLSNYVSYLNLSPAFRAFITRITTDEIPSSIQEALSIPRWKEAVLE